MLGLSEFLNTDSLFQYSAKIIKYNFDNIIIYQFVLILAKKVVGYIFSVNLFPL